MCLALPEAYQEPAWVGVRWRIRKKTFAHVATIDPERQRAYARAAGTAESICSLTFRSTGDELHALSNAGHPFFKPDWSPEVIGMIIDDGVDWDEVAELLTDSYCVRAPKKLAALVHGPV